MSMITIGIDPGLDGWIAVLDDGKIGRQATLYPIPVIEGRRRQYDAIGIYRFFGPAFLKGGILTADDDVRGVWIEEPGVFPHLVEKCPGCHMELEYCPHCTRRLPLRKNAMAAASQARCHALFELTCAVHDIPFNPVAARSWKKIMLAGTSGDKQAAIVRAKQLFPGVRLRATSRCKKDNPDMAEALMIAAYGERVL